MNRAILAVAGFLATPIGFLISNAVWIVGTALAWPFPNIVAVLTYVLSVEAILIGSAVLVAGDRDTLAIQLKLDKLIAAAPADNDAIGIEHEDAQTIREEREAVERANGPTDTTYS